MHSLLLAIAGTALLQDTVAAALALVPFTVGIMLKLRGEEQLLTQHFGSEYRDYQAHGRRLIPYGW